ncbi:perosamine synthetase [Kitasatospora sp. MAA4]|uniref:DegT/DnrJ/EryC1/StrS family aminotransferase n=1 Tax=Kitasatospora sp. MAA4 TaxID=3035093 RepID=UPI00247558F4|nr:DegT/DnrJ/EryC1/StrS family aminotransferase [Kitasatospora sp. MAA4]MDH6135203.1 perosamine synthetase [Kitasatospora sp. MAA4]
MAGAETVPVARPVIGEAEIAAAVRVLRSGSVVQGPEVAAFEREFSELVDGRACVAVNSGTSALYLSLLALGIGPGDEVVVPSFSFAATANAVRLVGAEPVFADIEADSFCLDPEAAAAAVGPRTAALLPVHLYGHPAAMDRLLPLAARHGLAVVEDACQAHAATLHGRPVGSFGAAGCFSFYPTKNMHALEGGMVVVQDARLAAKLRMLRNQGMAERYRHELVGANLRMTDVSAAVGRVQLAALAGWTERRRQHAKALDARLRGVPTPPVAVGAGHVYHQYTVRVAEQRARFQGELAQRGIGSAVHYAVPIHRQPAYAGGGEELPQTDRAAAEVLSLPVHPGLTEGELDRVATAVDAVAALLGSEL